MIHFQEVHGEVSINISREKKGNKPLRLWANLSKEQKRMAKSVYCNRQTDRISDIRCCPVCI